MCIGNHHSQNLSSDRWTTSTPFLYENTHLIPGAAGLKIYSLPSVLYVVRVSLDRQFYQCVDVVCSWPIRNSVKLALYK